MWVPGKTEVSVEHKEMAQFEYKGSKLTSGADEFGAAGKDLKTRVNSKLYTSLYSYLVHIASNIESC